MKLPATKNAGSIVAEASRLIDPSVAVANRISVIDSGAVMPSVPEAPCRAAQKSARYPRFFISGIMIDPIAAVSETDEPEMSPNMKLATTLEVPRPPRTLPTRTCAKSTSRSAMPDAYMRLPDRTKRGTARRA